ncbi:hypothetical protein RCL_jg1080.t1 [Rhizophagus clarus]|uniref:Uncharacterized protein n=1 Tax=Rhizophagus clarus TaxID=94130 RepID=A0A8H3M4K8_9GLOM|nr:hypothetical protein RCL_jg1080.t1 [Rhizophagus clarus]
MRFLMDEYLTSASSSSSYKKRKVYRIRIVLLKKHAKKISFHGLIDVLTPIMSQKYIVFGADYNMRVVVGTKKKKD